MAEVYFEPPSEDIYSATIQSWYVEEGDVVEAGEELVEMRTETDEYFIITAPVSGILKERYHEEDDEVEAGEVIAEIEEEEEGEIEEEE